MWIQISRRKGGLIGRLSHVVVHRAALSKKFEVLAFTAEGIALFMLKIYGL